MTGYGEGRESDGKSGVGRVRRAVEHSQHDSMGARVKAASALSYSQDACGTADAHDPALLGR